MHVVFFFPFHRCSYFLNKLISFDSTALRKLLNVKIIDDEEYEKNKTFMIVLEEPILLEVGQKHGEQHSHAAIGRLYFIYWLSLFIGVGVCVSVHCRRH